MDARLGNPAVTNVSLASHYFIYLVAQIPPRELPECQKIIDLIGRSEFILLSLGHGALL
jgi:hypothetical protein